MNRPTEAEIRAGIAGTLDVLDLVSLTASAVTPAFALPLAREFVDSLDEAAARRLAVILAVEAVWRMPLPAAVPRTDVDIAGRQHELSKWCWERRREAVRARKALRSRVEGRKVDPRGPRPPGGRKPPGGAA